MEAIDRATFHFSPTIGLALAVMVGFLVFAVALDLKWAQLHRVFRKPKAPLIGLMAQYLILPSVAFGVGLMMVDTPSIALGLLLVTCCPAGALSNYLTGVARGSVATSVSMTAISTLFSIAATPLLFAFWAAMNPDTQAVLQTIEMNPKRVMMMLVIMLLLPVTIGMLIRAKRPETADRIRLWSRRIAGLVFGVVVAILLLGHVEVLGTFATIALPPVLVTFAIAVALGWGLARASGLSAEDRRAVTLEVAFQNVALAIGVAVVFFPALAGVAITAISWGVVHLTLGFAIAALWMRVPIAESSIETRLPRVESAAVTTFSPSENGS
jgi:bile acid:Na+ symporter, BASS family